MSLQRSHAQLKWHAEAAAPTEKDVSQLPRGRCQAARLKGYTDVLVSKDVLMCSSSGP